jgi:hypothetical protein
MHPRNVSRLRREKERSRKDRPKEERTFLDPTEGDNVRGEGIVEDVIHRHVPFDCWPGVVVARGRDPARGGEDPNQDGEEDDSEDDAERPSTRALWM